MGWGGSGEGGSGWGTHMPGAPDAIGLTEKTVLASGASSTHIWAQRLAMFPVDLKLSDHEKELENT